MSSIPARSGDLQPLGSRGSNTRHNFDGFLTYSPSGDSSGDSYLQIFRAGSIEAVESKLIRDRGDGLSIPSVRYERQLIDGLSRFLALQKELGVEPPVFMMLSLSGVRGYRMGVDQSRIGLSEDNRIDRDALVLPEIMIESFDCDAAEVMRPAFDAIWNACGWPRSMNYDEEGKWVAH